MRIFEISRPQNLTNLVKQYANGIRFLISNDVDQATWIFGTNMEPIVVLSEKETINAFERLSKDELNEYFSDPFLGIFTHEIDEANITKTLMDGEIASIKKRYPKFKWNKSVISFITKNSNEANILDRSKMTNKMILPSCVENLGGIAHEIVISSNWQRYTSYTQSIMDMLE